MAYSYSDDYRFIESALLARERAFDALEVEIAGWAPKPREAFQESNDLSIARTTWAPGVDVEAMREKSLDFLSKPERQLSEAFWTRVHAELVTITILSHALCEAMINAFLALGLYQRNTAALFDLLEKAEIKDKWISGPIALEPAYTFPKDGQMYQTLHFLCKQRNALVHSKLVIQAADGQETYVKGSKLTRLSIPDGMHWARRFLKLPYELQAFIRTQGPFPYLLVERDLQSAKDQ